MTITSGLLLTVDAGKARTVSDELRNDPRFDVGDADGEKLPLVARVADAAEGEEVAEALRGRDGVRFVDVVCVFYGDEEVAS